MVDDVLGRLFQCRHEAGETLVATVLVVDHQHQLVIGGDAFFLDIEGTPRVAFDIHLVELEVAVGADHCIDLAGDQRGRQRPVDVDHLDIVQRQAVRLEHGAHQRLFVTAHRVTDLLALEIGQRLDWALIQHHQ